MKRVLSIAGGGMRGVIPGRMLMEIEERCGRPLWEVFDLVAGTSTGGILVCLIGAGVSAREAMKFYHESGPRIFRRSAARDLYSLVGTVHTRYDNDVLQRELAICLRGQMLAQARTRVMVTTLRNDRKAEMVKSWEPEWQDLSLASAALMTSAAQTYFPQAEIRRAGRVERYLDGGNVRNAPMACAAFEAGRLWWGEEILVLHLGTGRVRRAKALPNGGALFWAAEIFDCTTNGDDSYDEYFCRGLSQFVPGFRYERFDVELDAFPAMDDARAATLASLEEAAARALAAESDRLEAVCALLAGEERGVR